MSRVRTKAFRNMPHVTLQLPDAGERAFPCAEGDTILSAALRGGIGLAYECNSGGCGSCQVQLVEGEVEDLWPDAPGISPRARGKGRRLACQSIPLGDCTVRASLGEDAVPPVIPRRQVLTFTGKQALTPNMMEFTFAADRPADFVPGQYAMLTLPGVAGARAYSMSSLPNGDGAWRFVIKRVPGGAATGTLFDVLAPGDAVPADGPYGNGYLRTGNGRGIVCVAGGSGLSPVLSILRGAVRAPELSGGAIHLFFGGRGPEDLCVDEIFSSDPLLRERVTVHLAISDDAAPGAAEWQGERGFIHELVRRFLENETSQFDFYFCGPPPMTDAVHRMLLFDFKVPASQLHFDRFF